MPDHKAQIKITPLPDRVPGLGRRDSTTYSVRIHTRTKEQIDILNQFKQGLQDQLRAAIEEVVNIQWALLYPDQKPEILK